MSSTREGGTHFDGPFHGYDWKAVSDAYDRIYELPESAQARAVEAIPDEAVRAGVRALMASTEQPAHGKPLRQRGAAMTAAGARTAFVARRRERRGESPACAGSFVLLRPLGEGGMGEVFLGENPATGQRAAVKVLTSDCEDAAARFELEARQLATLDHAAIPRLLGQGVTDTGRPYLAMEYVKGAPVTEFANTRSLGTAERLELFALTCNAVRHAHLQLVAHLDVKPSNVLGYEGPEGKPRVALIDFGVSKSLSCLGDGSGWDAGSLTGSRQRPRTPAYAAPEQAQPAGSTTAADVFSLGVLLYELLTSVRPVEGGAPPSQVANLGVAGRQAWAIDTLVAKAIDPDPGRRHASADALLTDVQRVQNDRGPAGARASWPDRVRWFIARNRLRLVAGAVCTLGALAGLTAAHEQWGTSVRSRREAESDLAVVVADFLRSASGRDADALLVRAGEALQHGLERQPELEADLSLSVADALAARGRCDEASALYGRATLLRTQTASDHPVVIAGLRGQARCDAGSFGTGTEERTRRAAAYAQEALGAARTRYGPRSSVVAAIETDLVLYHAALGEFSLAGDQLGSAQAILARVDASAEADRLQDVRVQAGTRITVFPDVDGLAGVEIAQARVESSAAGLLGAQGDYAGAADRAQRATAPLVSRGGERSNTWAEAVAFGRTVEADALVHLGRHAAARQSADHAVAVLDAQFGAGDPRTVRARTCSAALAEAPRRAAALLRGVVRDAEETGEPATIASALQAYGRALRRSGDIAGAAAALERVVAVNGAEPRVLALALTDLSGLALDSGDEAKALEYGRDAVSSAQTLVPAPGLRLDVLLGAATARAEALLAAGRPDDAVSTLDPVVGTVRTAPRGVTRPENLEQAERLLRVAYAGI